VEIEKEKAAEAVVPDPEALEAELLKSRNDKESLLADYQCLKERLPVLEQQLQDRQNRLQEHKESIQRMTLIKAREAKVKYTSEIIYLFFQYSIYLFTFYY